MSLAQLCSEKTVKAEDLRKKTHKDLDKELLELRKEGFNLRMQRAVGQTSHAHRFKLNRRNIARVKTVLNEKGL